MTGTGHTEAAGRQNEAYTPTTEEVRECWTTRNDIGNPYETDADVEERHHEESVKFDRWLRTVKAEAWHEGQERGWTDAMESVQPDDTAVSRALAGVSPNPYESEES
ncbi:hypothetical protein [Bifidobacterium mongoliense]|uniref:Uncharacterized protein n=1 Tax=Bifidobacterium mongoliense TaxID=518643 RepID=A0A423UE29_9BIFI|nr:hypothetical protein [Bifidobacterium mongoliense]ROT86957.1 hypothetical protein BMONG18_0956 [Bifidobacterium mongoliense]